MKLRTIFISSFLTVAMAGASSLPAQTLSENEILSQADARIQKYRTGDAELRLVTPDRRGLKKGACVKIEQTRHSFLFGCNLFMLNKCRTAAENVVYEKEFSDLFNYATLPFYWWQYEREAGHPNYEDTDRSVAWCSAHHVTMKGHPLAWNEGQPAWLPSDLADVTRLQMQRITDIVRRFKGEIDLWDVVNEATEFDRVSTRQGGPTLTAAIRRTGVEDYLRTAFLCARAANPQATLVINDYITSQDYQQKVLSRLVDDSGHPLFDVIGIQCHQHRQPWSAAKTWEICERFAVSGKPLHFTEATILSGQLGYELKKESPQFDWASTAEGEQRQEKAVVEFYTTLFSHPVVEAITWWDFSDQGAWQGAPAGLVRADMTPKPAYIALMKLIKGQWWTRTQASVARNATARFHGFYGEYKVTAEEHGRQIVGTFTFDPQTPQPIEVKLY